ncbi:hypothetical protein [Aurantiacibacter odishensis]|uniref:hypothetical protein n=1 Tax=Aurantiacibacter odishensis TaxID=1155476 RepID=UPI000E70FF9B|nr:hypothetical protein [Aurantiacibacter odishensis]
MSRYAQISRREFVKWSGFASTCGTTWQSALAAPLADTPRGLNALLLDTRFGRLQPNAVSHVPVLRFSGDVTGVWYDELDTRWRRKGFVLGGITGADALFVLETLANDRGRRVVSRTPLDLPRVKDVEAVRWIIAPHHPSVSA